MAPNIDREAEHIKEKARKDLLALLENVRVYGTDSVRQFRS